MRIAESRLRSIIRSVIAESNFDLKNRNKLVIKTFSTYPFYVEVSGIIDDVDENDIEFWSAKEGGIIVDEKEAIRAATGEAGEEEIATQQSNSLTRSVFIRFPDGLPGDKKDQILFYLNYFLNK